MLFESSLNVFQTNRLTIRKLVDDDIANLSLVLSDREVMRFSTVGVHTHSQLLEYICKCTEQYKTQKFGKWAISTTLNDLFIGLCGLTMAEDGLVHINYRLTSKSQGKGYAAEAVLGLLEYAKNTLNIETVSALIEPENVSSIKVVTRSGFTFKEKSSFHGFDVNLYQISIAEQGVTKA
jgi:RimJ/RimL family protein N-acetyltransferase